MRSFMRMRTILKTHPLLYFFIILQAVVGFDAIMLEYLASVHRMPVMFLPFHLQSDPISANQFALFSILAIAICGFYQWSIIEE